MAQTKKSKPKAQVDSDEIIPPKIKKEKEFDLEGNEIFPPVEKLDDPEAVEETEETDEAEGIELDDEEINPFKDKWEE